MLNSIFEAIAIYGLSVIIILVPLIIVLYIIKSIILDVILRLRDDRDERLQDDYHE